MRRTLLMGLALTAAACLAVLLSDPLDLELESVALLGAAAGAVVALVPDTTPLGRLLGFVAGFAAAWAAYALRASTLPDSTTGRTVAVALVVLACTTVAVAARGRVALWSTVLGAGVFAGAYELTYVAAPPEMASTSVSTATTLLVTLGLGFLAAALFAPAATGRRSSGVHDARDDRFDASLETAR